MRHCSRILLLPLMFASVAHADYYFTWDTSFVNAGTWFVAGNVNFAVTPDGGGYDLVITLSNTSNVVQQHSSAALTGLFWNITVDGNDPAGLPMMSAKATGGLINSDGSTAIAGTADYNICADNSDTSLVSCSSTLDGGWQTKYTTASAGFSNTFPAAVHWGIGTAGLSGIFEGGLVNGTNSTPYGPGGNFDFALVHNLDTTHMDTTPYVLDTATFVLTGLTSSNVVISDVLPAYGTAPEGVPTTTSEQPPENLPEPATMSVMCGGLGLLAWKRLRR
jgi:hypothetical protein